MILFLSTAFGCDEPVDNRALQGSLERAEAAYADLDDTGFRAAVSEVDAGVPCLSEALTPELAGRLHAVKGLAAFSSKDVRLAEQSFAAARATDSGIALPTTIAVEGSPLAEHFAAVDLATSPVRHLQPDSEGYFLLDGRRVLERRIELPTVYQRFGSSEALEASAYVPVGALPPVREVRSKELRGRPYFLLGTGLLVTSGALMMGSRIKKGEYDAAVAGGLCANPAPGEADCVIRNKGRAVRTYSVASGVALGAGIGVTTLAFSIAI